MNTRCKKQCGCCKHQNNPPKRAACNVSAKHTLLDAVVMMRNCNDLPYCSEFIPEHKRGNHGK